MASLASRLRYHIRKGRRSRFRRLKQDAGGMMAAETYERIYELVFEQPDLDIIEIGGAAGAASIAIAWAMQGSGKRARLIVAEKCQGGSRVEHGGYEDNLRLIEDNFRRFGVESRIQLYPHEVTFEGGDEILGLMGSPELAALVHDADGRIDRDFHLFWPRLRPGGLIVIDDYVNQKKFRSITERHPQGGIKRVMTFRLLNQLIAWGLFRASFQIGNTIFGTKPPGADLARLKPDRCREIIEEIECERDESLCARVRNVDSIGRGEQQ